MLTVGLNRTCLHRVPTLAAALFEFDAGVLKQARYKCTLGGVYIQLSPDAVMCDDFVFRRDVSDGIDFRVRQAVSFRSNLTRFPNAYPPSREL